MYIANDVQSLWPCCFLMYLFEVGSWMKITFEDCWCEIITGHIPFQSPNQQCESTTVMLCEILDILMCSINIFKCPTRKYFVAYLTTNILLIWHGCICRDRCNLYIKEMLWFLNLIYNLKTYLSYCMVLLTLFFILLYSYHWKFVGVE